MVLHIQADFECVFFINGEFFERADSLTMSEYDVAYVTVMPLRPALLPYTVKLCGAETVSTELAFGIRLNGDDYALCLSPRYPVIYGMPPKPRAPVSPIARVFAFLKNGDTDSAYALLSADLKATANKAALSDFFNGYERLIECPWSEQKCRFYLIDKNGIAKPHKYTVSDGFIDDITDE